MSDRTERACGYTSTIHVNTSGNSSTVTAYNSCVRAPGEICPFGIPAHPTSVTHAVAPGQETGDVVKGVRQDERGTRLRCLQQQFARRKD